MCIAISFSLQWLTRKRWCAWIAWNRFPWTTLYFRLSVTMTIAFGIPVVCCFGVSRACSLFYIIFIIWSRWRRIHIIIKREFRALSVNFWLSFEVFGTTLPQHSLKVMPSPGLFNLLDFGNVRTWSYLILCCNSSIWTLSVLH